MRKAFRGGRIRAMTVFGPPSDGAILREVVAPFRDLGMLGAATTRSQRRGESDHSSFNEAGLPGSVTLQDPIRYRSKTWHTNLDTCERIVEDHVKASAITIAAAVYHLAMREEQLPWFAADEIPPRPRQQLRSPAAPAQPATAAAPVAGVAGR